MSKNRKKMRGTVQKVIQSSYPTDAEKAQIDIKEADHLYREIRVPNVLTDEKGEKRVLKEGADVDIVIEADSSATLKKED